MSRDKDFLARWHAERSQYATWGKHLSETVVATLAEAIAPSEASAFLKIPVTPRLKDDEKLVEKAFYRNKAYRDPFVQITDKVGTRFVVLLYSEIRTVEAVLTGIPGWTCSKDRDYEAEQKANPLEFSYAAVHYVVRPTADIDVGGVIIPAGTPCEVQIKTLLQHAWSELTHDTIYKQQIEATHSMHRSAAKAMALLEATNDYFERVAIEVSAALAAVRQVTSDLSAIYKDEIGIDPKPTVLEGMLLDAYEQKPDVDVIAEIRSLLQEKSFLADNIRDRVAQGNPIFSQPAVLLAYLVASQSPRRAQSCWPLTPAEIEPLLNDLGESIH